MEIIYFLIKNGYYIHLVPLPPYDVKLVERYEQKAGIFVVRFDDGATKRNQMSLASNSVIEPWSV
jgi:hypothetical protein